MWGFWDSAHWRPQAAIAEGDAVTPNQAGEAYIRLLHEVMQTATEKYLGAKEMFLSIEAGSQFIYTKIQSHEVVAPIALLKAISRSYYIVKSHPSPIHEV